MSSYYRASSPDPLRPRSTLASRILHPDILLPILSYLPATYLPPVIRTSRYFHSLATPLLYADLPLGTLSRTSLCPHISPLGSLFPPGASHSDLRAMLRVQPNRKRLALESAKVLRVGYHSHPALPGCMEDLRLDMSRVEVLHVDGTAICHNSTCPMLVNLRPRVVVLESPGLAFDRIGGLSPDVAIDHLIVKLRPTEQGMFPCLSSSPLHILRVVKRLTIIFTPRTYLDRKGQEVIESWRPSRLPKCGEHEHTWTARPSFSDMVRHILTASSGIDHVQVIGGEELDEEWVGAEHEKRCAIRLRQEGWLDKEIQRIRREMYAEGEWAGTATDDVVGAAIQVLSREQWLATRDGKYLDPPPIQAGFKGKGAARRPVLSHKAVSV